MTTDLTAQDRLTSDPGLRRYSDVRELIANPANPTPLVAFAWGSRSTSRTR